MSERRRVTGLVAIVAVGLLTAGTAFAQKGDANQNGVTDEQDHQFVTVRLGCSVENDGPGCAAADVNCDGAVNPFDTGFVIAHFGARDLLLLPVPGLTLGMHAAPARTGAPLGTTLRFRVELPADAAITWTGAVEVRRNDRGSIAECPLTELGQTEARADITLTDGLCWTEIMFLNVVDVPVEDITIGSVHASVAELELDEDSTNEETMAYYFGESIASLTQVSPDRYVTSIDRTVTLNAVVQPPMFAPLIEWRVNGVPSALGAPAEIEFMDRGAHGISGGPPAAAGQIQIATYGVTITGQFEGDIIPEGVPVTFQAVTDPPGYENHVTWLSSTKYGTAVPVVGQGPTFAVQFDDTFQEQPAGFTWQWLGVKGDNFAMGQDEKECILGLFPCCNDFFGGCIDVFLICAAVGDHCEMDAMNDCVCAF